MYTGCSENDRRGRHVKRIAHLGSTSSGASRSGLGARRGARAARHAVLRGSRLRYEVRVRQRSLGHLAEGLASRALLAVLAVGRKVERDEEDQVRAESDDASKSSKFLAGAVAGVGQPGEVGRGEVGVRGKVDEACHI